jgi:hypothetical protein
VDEDRVDEVVRRFDEFDELLGIQHVSQSACQRDGPRPPARRGCVWWAVVFDES